ncbi:MAG TPA: hypothetical protein VLE47_01595 [Candidatus Saccharimonadales bacterium]|nr:hypothetical protein [Candidatus Saccharimonadales bacterium]
MPEWFHTLVLIIHVIGAGLIIGMAFTSLLVLTTKPFVPESMKVMQRFAKFGPFIFLTQLLTGLYLAWSEYDKFRGNPLLTAKLVLFLGMAGASIYIARQAAAKAKAGTPPSPNITWAWISFLTILLIATFGVMLAESTG